MKLLTYKIKNLDTQQIGVIQNQSVYNLTNCFGNISLVDLIQLEDYQDHVANFISNNDCLKHDIKDITVLPVIPKPTAIVFVLMLGVGCSFISPIGYQTNLMVYGPGGYRFLDYARLGLPLTILLGIVSGVLAPIVYGL